MSRALIKCVGVALLWGIFQSIYFLSTSGDLLFSDLIFRFGFAEVDFNIFYLSELSINLLPFILFQAFFGTYIYQHFTTASVYYFSRQPDRVKWFYKECVKLYALALLYPIMMVISGTLVASVTNEVIFNQGSIILFVYYVLIHSLWLYLTTLLINIISIKFDSSYGFVSVIGFQLAGVVALLLWENVFPLVDTPYIARHAFLLKLNPISHLILSWHSSPIDGYIERLNSLNIDFSFNTSVISFLILSIIVGVIGSIVVKRQEWITQSNGR